MRTPSTGVRTLCQKVALSPPLESPLSLVTQPPRALPTSSINTASGYQLLQTDFASHAMDAFVGSWKLESSENFEEVMQRLGINAMTRKAGNLSKPTITYTKVGDNTYNMKTASTFKNIEMTFTLGEEFDEKTMDGRHVKSVITFEDGSMRHISKSDKVTDITRTVEGNKIIAVGPKQLLNRTSFRFFSQLYAVLTLF